MLWIEKPIVAAVNGPAVGLGATVALLCDVVVMAKEAKIGDRHVNVGLVAGDGGAAIWPLLVGVNRAKELLMTGHLLTGDEASQIGLVNRVVPLVDLDKTVSEIAEELAELPPYAVRGTKVSVNRILRAQVEKVLDVSLALEELSMLSEEHKRACMAFVASHGHKTE
jgi:enoyl-CoA hydratase